MPQQPPQPKPTRDRKKRSPTPRAQTAPLPVEDPTPPPGPGHLAPRRGESAEHHRAFLLWAMQEPSRRSYRATSRALDLGDITIRRYASRFKWKERVKVEASDRLAWKEYLGRYPDTYGIQGVGDSSYFFRKF